MIKLQNIHKNKYIYVDIVSFCDYNYIIQVIYYEIDKMNYITIKHIVELKSHNDSTRKYDCWQSTVGYIPQN